MSTDYSSIKISVEQAADIAKALYNIEGEIKPMPGDRDFNFWLKTKDQGYMLKVSRPDEDPAFLSYLQDVLLYIQQIKTDIISPIAYPDTNGAFVSEITDAHGQARPVRLLSWIDGRLWSEVKPLTDDLLFSLGEQAGKLTTVLQDFEHPLTHREFEWDVAQAFWVRDHLDLFDPVQKEIVEYFMDRYESFQDNYSNLRKGVVHSDVNNNNIIVTEDLTAPKVKALIDLGDTIHTQVINDLAIAIAYALMDTIDGLSAALPIISGYHSQFTLLEEELDYLHTLAAIRLLISGTSATLSKQQEPENVYKHLSEKLAWDALYKWRGIHTNLASYHFRKACGFTPHPSHSQFTTWAKSQNRSIRDLFPSLDLNNVQPIDMSVSSIWIGHASEYTDLELTNYKLNRLYTTQPNTLFSGGYAEVRPFYTTQAFQKEGNHGPEYRTVHLGVDFWVPENTPIHALFDGTVYSIHNNDLDKDYGPTLILQHKTDDDVSFFTLYGHLSVSSLSLFKSGDKVNRNDLIAYVGHSNENGNWPPHLHFQIMLDMLGNENNFPGVCYPIETEVWKSICPDPNLFFKERGLDAPGHTDKTDLLSYRKNHLGKSLSLSYNEPLNIMRGSGAYLMDDSGRKYLDTVNNVAHVGHEHPRVVQAGQKQMAVLNTNSRYLHHNINEFAKALLNTFPEELSVVHFVNSGSEANELAMRKAQAYTNQKDMIAIEIGYHGNTGGCVNVSSYKFDGKGGQGKPEHTHIVPLPDSYRGMYQGEDTGASYAKHIQDQIDHIQSKGRNVAGFIFESIISCGGQIELPANYLNIAFNAVRKAGGLCIADEVQVGCGRVGSHFWGFELHDVVPDIVTIGKPIGNGHPVAAVVCTRAVADTFANGMEYFNTFGGNPVSCAIGHEVLKVIQDENLQENALNVGNYLKAELQNLQSQFPMIGDVRGQGLFLGFELTDSNKNPLPKHASYLANRMKELGILISTDGMDHNALKFKPPMVFSKDHVDEYLSRLQTIFQEDFMQQL